MFSHREHGFPIGGEEAKEKDWLRPKAAIWRMILRQLENEEMLSVYRLPFGTGDF